MNKNITRFEMYAPERAEGPLPVVCLLAGPDPALELDGAIGRAARGPEKTRPFIAVAVGTNEWNSDYSPWPAPPVMKGEPPFTGRAPGMLRWLTQELIPAVELKYSALGTPRGRFIAGYSLAGLAALYAMYITDAFGACASCSGSLWFDGWADYMAASRPHPGSRIYLSLGKTEEKTKNARMAAVGDVTRAAHSLLSRDGSVDGTALVFNDGGHFSNIPGRVARAVAWLLAQ